MSIKQFIIKVCRRLKPLFPNEESYLRVIFYLKMGYKLDLKDPKTFSEKCQWLKLYNRRPEYVNMVDKYAVKGYVASIIGDKYIIPSFGVWDSPEEIDWDRLPQQFVLKTTHGGGGAGVVICKKKDSLDRVDTVKKLSAAMKQDIAKYSCEWMYSRVPHRIIAEELLVETGKTSPDDYKVMCFNGEVKYIEYHTGRYSGVHTQDFYDRNWNLTKITQGSYGAFNTEPSPKPELLDEMIKMSELLSKGMPHVRIDWYLLNKQLFFGEITFFDGSGLCPFDRYEDDLLLGSLIKLPQRTSRL